jgi:hypothetical protein
MTINAVPSIEKKGTAVVRAVNARRERHDTDPANTGLSPAAIPSA